MQWIVTRFRRARKKNPAAQTGVANHCMASHTCRMVHDVTADEVNSRKHPP